MGRDVGTEHFAPGDVERFAERLRQDLDVLAELVARPGFGEGPRTLGAELELFLVDEAQGGAPANREVLADSVDPRFSLELDRFDLEFNASPVPFGGRPFGALEDEFRGAMVALDGAAGRHGAATVPIGILPTLRFDELQSSSMSDLPRYRALSRAIRARRGEPFQIRINGDEPLSTRADDVTLEGANASLQLHVRVAPAEFAALYNAAQIATAPALAASGNSPLFLGHLLWEETRIALFKQAVDERAPGRSVWRPPPRVGFGLGWVREGAHELFAETVALYPPLLPFLSAEDPRELLRRGEIPELRELRLHQSTVWRWNRPVYDAASGGHIRIELRALPAGPSVIDMAANAAFLLGLAFGLSPGIRDHLVRLPFERAHHNFYRAAQHGLEAKLYWPCERAPSPRSVRAADLVLDLLPLARDGLLGAGVSRGEADRLLGIIRRRVERRQTGARWQREALARLERRRSRESALRALVAHYRANVRSGRPVHEWPMI